MINTIKSTLAFVLIFSLGACVKDELNLDQLQYNLNPEFGLKLATAELDMKNLISHFDDNGVVEDSAGFLSVVYQGNIATVNALDVITIPDQFLNLNTSLSPVEIDYLATNDSVVVERFFDVEFTLDDGTDIIDSLQIHSADLHISSSTPVPCKGEIAILKPQTNTPVWSGSFEDLQQPFSVEETYGLENITLHYAIGSSGTSQLRAYYRITLYAPEDGSIPELFVNASLNNINYKGIFGKLQPRSVSVADSRIKLDIFNSDYNATFGIADPSIKFYVANSFGVQAEFQLPELSGYRDEVQVFNLLNPYTTILPEISAAPFPYTTIDTNLVIYNSSSNPPLSELMLQKPQELEADVTAELSTPDDSQSFVMDSSKLKIDMEARFPLYGYINDFQFVDTTHAELQGITGNPDDPSQITAVTVRLSVSNKLPLDVQVQILFLDSTFQLLDSLFQQQQPVIKSAPVNHLVSPEDPDYGRTTGTTEATTDIFMDRQKLNKIAATSQIVIRVSGNTTENKPFNVRIFSDDKIAVALSAKADFSLENDE